jgi:two-component system phosphate regulon sensor histidine kinase PhoR
MSQKPLFWKIYPSYLLLIVLSVWAVSWYAGRAQQGLYQQHAQQELENAARLIESQLACLVAAESEQGASAKRELDMSIQRELQTLCAELAQRSSLRVTVIGVDGRVYADSEKAPAVMDNHGDRPEVAGAVRGKVGSSVRFSNTLHLPMLYVAVPIMLQNRIAGVVRTSRPLTEIAELQRAVFHNLVIVGTIIGLLATALSWVLVRRITHPIRQMQECARRFAQGDLQARMHVTSAAELTELGETMNQMAAELGERMRMVVRQHNELETMLGSMLEGVLAVDNDGRIIKLNRCAAQMLAVEEVEACGHSIQEVVRNVALQKVAADTVKTAQPVERDIQFWQDGHELSLQVHGTPLLNAEKAPFGVLMVLNDVTRLRRLENLRREFAANVSHELRTPITSIKGFVETLLDGALEDRDDARHFLDIILKQTNRLNAIIADLLVLAAVEKQSEAGEVARDACRLRECLEFACAACRPEASQKNITLKIDCDAELELMLNAGLFEQAVVNLLQNAIRHSPDNGNVRICVDSVEGEVLVKVQDDGCGIAPEHLERLFERFYRVDKGRSRQDGGTGLGLAIVKHVAQIHGGHVGVESQPGQGSTFTLSLPLDVPPSERRPGKNLG